jgi:cellobiose-specific phosphotransferase system component IIC
VLIQFAVSALIWYPFFKAYEKTKLAEEAAAK